MDYKLKYLKYKAKYVRLRNKQYGGVILFDELSKYVPKHLEYYFAKILGDNTIKNNEGIIQIKIKDNYDNIEWEKLKQGFKNGIISVDVMKGLGGLRKATVNYLISKDGDFFPQCYSEFGSNTPTSDLDFTYITYNDPSKVMGKLISFYNSFYLLYNNYPDVAFDTNFYICNTYVPKECYNLITNDRIKSLFVKACDKFYNLGAYTDDRYVIIDSSICVNVLDKKLECKTLKNKFANLVKYATIFYDLLANCEKLAINNNILILILRSLYYYMCLYSNESYICDATIRFFVHKKDDITASEKYIAYIDNFCFINEWYELYEQGDDFVGFIDGVSKYIVRCSKLLTDGYHHIDPDLLLLCEFWLESIRGKKEINTIRIKGESNDSDILKAIELIQIISDKYKTIKNIYIELFSIYGSIRKSLSMSTNANHLIEIINTLAEKVDVSIDPIINVNKKIEIDTYNIFELIVI